MVCPRENKCSRSTVKVRKDHSGIHFYNRQTGLNILLDEIRVPPNEWDTAPRQVSIALTTKCDLSCPYCFSPKSIAELELDCLSTWLREFDKNGSLGVGFGGGEPTLYPRLAELCHFTSDNTSLAITLTTHGHHINKDLIDSLKGTIHFIRISMDGVGYTYEKLRGRSFKSLINNIKMASSLAPFGINFLVNSTTFPDLDAAIKLAAELGASEFLLLPELSTHNVPGIDRKTSDLFCNWVKNYKGNLSLTISEAGAEGIPTCNPHDYDAPLNSYVHIDAEGVLKKTSFDASGVTIGYAGVMNAFTLLQSIHKEK